MTAGLRFLFFEASCCLTATRKNWVLPSAFFDARVCLNVSRLSYSVGYCLHFLGMAYASTSPMTYRAYSQSVRRVLRGGRLLPRGASPGRWTRGIHSGASCTLSQGVSRHLWRLRGRESHLLGAFWPISKT